MLSRTLGLMKITAVIVKGETDAEFEVKSYNSIVFLPRRTIEIRFLVCKSVFEELNSRVRLRLEPDERKGGRQY